ncbi:MAG: carboxypeptidase-like regulatory domain-containing protein [Bacteroidia bacterium]|nr:carboxypeptidase-like regulatory domain-containing protein [Bacteroidia bacterium]
MKHCYAAVWLLMACAALPAQQWHHQPAQSVWTYLYRLEDPEARKLYRHPGRQPDFDWLLTQPADSFPSDSTAPARIPPGHYLMACALADQWVFQLFSVARLRIVLPDNQTDATVMVYTPAGAPVEHAHVQLDGRRLAYDPQTRAYRLPHTRREGLLEVEHEGHTEYLVLDNAACRPLWKRIVYGRPQRYLWQVPFSLVHDPVRSLIRLRPYGWVWRLTRAVTPQTQGLIVTSQPKYQPGDTLRGKIYAYRKHQKPLRSTLILSIYGRTGNTTRTFVADTLRPYRPGLYTFETVLHDSLGWNLDQQLALAAQLRFSRRRAIRSSVPYEAYVLNGLQLELHPAPDQAFGGDTLTVRAVARDETGLPLAGAAIVWTVEARSITRWYEPGYVPDTLLCQTLPLLPDGSCTFAFPDSLLPPADFQLSISALLQTPAQEQVLETCVIPYQHLPQRLSLAYEGDSLYAEYRTGSGPAPADAILRAFDPQGRLLYERTLRLPARVPLHPLAAQYWLQSGARTAQAAGAPLVEAFASRDADSLRIRIANPRQLPVMAVLWHQDREIWRGSGPEPALGLRARARGLYFLSLQYLWEGQPVSLDYQIPFQQRRLQVSMLQPARIAPGDTATLEVRVADAQGRPVKHADVLAWGISARFSGYAPPELPLPRRRSRGRHQLHRYETSPPRQHVHESPLDYAAMRQRFGLDTLAWYQLLYPDTAIRRFSLPAPPDKAWFAPFALRDGRPEAIHWIKLDGEPIFFADVSQPLNYVFEADTSLHWIEFRTRLHQVRLDSLRFAPGSRHVLAVDLNGVHPHLRVREADPVYSAAEQQMLEQRTLRLHPASFAKHTHVWQGSRVWVLPDAYRSGITLGPLRNDSVHQTLPGQYQTGTEFEPGWTYEFQRGLVKLRQLPAPKPPFRMGWRSETAGSIRSRLDEIPLTRDSLLRAYQEDLFQSVYAGWRYDQHRQTGLGYGSLRLQYPDAQGLLSAILLIDAQNPDAAVRMYAPSARTLHQIPPGGYELMLFRSDSAWAQVSGIRIQKHGVWLALLDELDFRPPDARSRAILRLAADRFAGKQETLRQEQQIRRLYHQADTLPKPPFSAFISGMVRDEHGEPLPGATILIKGTTWGTLADESGVFGLYAPSQGILVCSYLGYETRELLLAGRSRIDIEMKAHEMQMDEVIVTGYSVQIRRAVTSSISSIQIRGMASLQGAVAGVVIADAGSPSLEIPALEPEALQLAPGDSLLRSAFSDGAFWAPRLRTDAGGSVRYPVRFPGDLTRWNTFALASAGRRRRGTGQGSIVAFRPLSARLETPRFLIAGDSVRVIGSVRNFTGSPVAAGLRFWLGSSLLHSLEGEVRDGQAEALALRAPAGADSLTLRWQLRTPAGYQDGEQRSIPVLPAGAPEYRGELRILDTDSGTQIRADSAWGALQLYARSDLREVLEAEAIRLRQYPHACNEQQASRLKALLAERSLAASLGRPFPWEPEIRSLIRKLCAAQLPAGPWAWWGAGNPSIWVTLHVADALLEAERAGFAAPFDRGSLGDYLLFHRGKLEPSDRIAASAVCLRIGATAEIAAELAVLDTFAHRLELPVYLRYLRLRQLAGAPWPMDSLMKHQRRTLLGNLYWPGSSSWINYTSLDATLSAYELLRGAQAPQADLDRIVGFLLEERKWQGGYWRNTYEASRALAAAMEQMAARKPLDRLPALIIRQGSRRDSVAEFPYTAQYPAAGPIACELQGPGPLYLSWSQERFSAQPSPDSGAFVLRSSWLEGGRPVVQLRAGTPVTFRTTVEVQALSEYVLIDLPIPAGCFYQEPKAAPNWQAGERYREYRPDRVSVYCERLQPGVYTFDVQLLPRFTGAFTVNPAQALPMYLPWAGGSTPMARMEIR